MWWLEKLKKKKKSRILPEGEELGCEEEVKSTGFFQGFYLGDLFFLGHLSHTRVKEKKNLECHVNNLGNGPSHRGKRMEMPRAEDTLAFVPIRPAAPLAFS